MKVNDLLREGTDLTDDELGGQKFLFNMIQKTLARSRVVMRIAGWPMGTYTEADLVMVQMTEAMNGNPLIQCSAFFAPGRDLDSKANNIFITAESAGEWTIKKDGDHYLLTRKDQK